MQALKLDYRRQNVWQQRSGWAALLLVSLATAGLGWQHRQLDLEITAAREELSRLGGHRPLQNSRSSGQGKNVDTEIGYAHDVLMQLDVPWQSLFDAVETTTNEEISLLGIEPDPRRGQVRIIGEAKTYAASLDYVRRLEASAPLYGVYLQHHQIQTQDRERPIHFIIGAAWGERP